MLDRDLLIQLMSEFEHGADLDPDNPFLPEQEGGFQAVVEDLLPITEPFLEGGAVPDTAKWLPPVEHPHALAFATAGLLQGLAIGYEYAKRRGD